MEFQKFPTTTYTIETVVIVLTKKADESDESASICQHLKSNKH